MSITDQCPTCGGVLGSCVCSARRRTVAEDMEVAETTYLDLKQRLRRTAQILIDEVGADGPMNAEEAAEKAIDQIRCLRDKLARVKYFVGEFGS